MVKASALVRQALTPLVSHPMDAARQMTLALPARTALAYCPARAPEGQRNHHDQREERVPRMCNKGGRDHHHGVDCRDRDEAPVRGAGKRGVGGQQLHEDAGLARTPPQPRRETITVIHTTAPLPPSATQVPGRPKMNITPKTRNTAPPIMKTIADRIATIAEKLPR